MVVTDLKLGSGDTVELQPDGREQRADGSTRPKLKLTVQRAQGRGAPLAGSSHGAVFGMQQYGATTGATTGVMNPVAFWNPALMQAMGPWVIGGGGTHFGLLPVAHRK